MDDRTTESSVATGLRITFAIIGAILIMICTTCIALKVTIFNDHFLLDIVQSKSFRKLAQEEMDMNDVLLSNNSDVRIDFSDDEVYDEFFDIAYEDIIDFMLNGDREVDEDKYEDFFEEYDDEIFGDQNLTSAQKREEVRSFIDQLQDMFDNYEDEDFYSALDTYNEASHNILVAAVVTGAFIAIMTVVLIVIHKNKFRPIRAMGIAAASAGLLNTLGSAFMLAAFKVATEEAYSEEEEVVRVIVEYLEDCSVSFIMIMLATLAIGVVMIVVGAVGANNFNKQHIEE